MQTHTGTHSSLVFAGISLLPSRNTFARHAPSPMQPCCNCHCSRCLCIERDNKNEILPTVALFMHWQCHENRIVRIFYVGRLAKIQFIYYQQRNIANITQESNNNNRCKLSLHAQREKEREQTREQEAYRIYLSVGGILMNIG